MKKLLAQFMFCFSCVIIISCDTGEYYEILDDDTIESYMDKEKLNEIELAKISTETGNLDSEDLMPEEDKIKKKRESNSENDLNWQQ